jgi:hypothetical protein
VKPDMEKMEAEWEAKSQAEPLPAS